MKKVCNLLLKDYLVKLGKAISPYIHALAMKRGLNPKKLNVDEMAWLTEELMMDVNFVNRFFEKHWELIQKNSWN